MPSKTYLITLITIGIIGFILGLIAGVGIMTTDKRYMVYNEDNVEYLSGYELAKNAIEKNWAVFPRSWYNVGTRDKLPNPNNLVSSFEKKGYKVVFLGVRQFNEFKREFYEEM